MRRLAAITLGVTLLLTCVIIGVTRFGRRASDAAAPATQPGRVVLYCATDREVVQEILDRFERETGIHVDAKFDTEAAKAVGLVQALRQEKSNPQCDVFWGGGPFFCTILANDGCLAVAPQDLIEAHGSAPRDPQGRWLGFAGSYRVLIVNTDLMPSEPPHSYRDLVDPRYKGRIGIANPLFGGMAAHVAALFAQLGEAEGRRYLQQLKANDVALCSGMADVRNRVASGELWFGITSTVDAHVAIDAGKPVKIIFPDQADSDIGCFPHCNTVALVAGAPHPKEAERLLRFLLSAQTELSLAAGPGQHIGMLPQSVAEDIGPAWIPRGLRTMKVDWSAAVHAHPAAVKAIKEILLGQ